MGASGSEQSQGYSGKLAYFAHAGKRTGWTLRVRGLHGGAGGPVQGPGPDPIAWVLGPGLGGRILQEGPRLPGARGPVRPGAGAAGAPPGLGARGLGQDEHRRQLTFTDCLGSPVPSG